VYQLIDTHAHLDEIEDPEQVVTEARAAKLIAIIAVGSDYESNQRVLNLANTYSNFVYPTLGLHPQNLEGADIELNIEFIKAHMQELVGIGEIGLDYHKRVRARAGKDLQKYVLKELLELSRTHEKPALIHSRYAWQDALNLVIDSQVERAVFHWYTGTSSVLRDIISHGYYISATPAVEYHEEHRRAVKATPLARLLLETDCPVVYRRGTDYEYESRPSDTARVLKAVSLLRGVDEDEIAVITTDNASRLFGIQNVV
jgi:TatD DNase family protein